MKFACEHCGRSYAVADELRGKTFKMKCKACGHLIVVKGTHAAEPAGRPRGAPPGAEATPTPVTIAGTPPGDEPLDPRPRAEATPAPEAAPAPEPMAVPEENPFVARPISAAGLAHLAARPQPAGQGSLPPPPAEKYVDLVIDDEPAGRPAAGAAEREGAEPSPPARGGAGSPDPFADWETLGEVERVPAEPGDPVAVGPAGEPAAARSARAAPRREPRIELAPRRPPAGEGLNPKVLAIAGGVAVAVVAVLLLVYVGRGGKGAGPSVTVEARPAPAAAQPAAVPAPAPVAATQTPPGSSPPIPALAEPAPGREEEPSPRRVEPAPRKPKPAKTAREERRAEPGSAPAPRAEPAAQPAAPAAAPEASEAQARAQPPTAEQITRVVSANRRAFEQCVAEAGKRDPGLDLSGRQVTLMLTVNPSGNVAYPTIDDVELNKTDLGACIKSAARLMMFPAFEGDPVKVEVPLTLGR